HKVQEGPEVLVEAAGAGEEVRGQGVAGESVGRGAPLREPVEDVPPLLLEELVLEEVGDPGGHLHGLVAQRGNKPGVDAPLGGGHRGGNPPEASLQQEILQEAVLPPGVEDLLVEELATILLHHGASSWAAARSTV